jgi:hypothetical protein
VGGDAEGRAPFPIALTCYPARHRGPETVSCTRPGPSSSFQPSPTPGCLAPLPKARGPCACWLLEGDRLAERPVARAAPAAAPHGPRQLVPATWRRLADVDLSCAGLPRNLTQTPTWPSAQYEPALVRRLNSSAAHQHRVWRSAGPKPVRTLYAVRSAECRDAGARNRWRGAGSGSCSPD